MALNKVFGTTDEDRVFNDLLTVLRKLSVITREQRAERVRGLNNIFLPGAYSQIVDKAIQDDPPMKVINALLKAANYKGDK